MRWHQPATALLLALPLCWLGITALTGGLGVNPIETALHTLGHWSLRLLLLTLLLGTLSRLSGWHWPLALRRLVGLFAFAYALLHLLVYLVLDQSWEPQAILEDLRHRPYILLGLTAWLLLLVMTLTSTRGWQRRLAERWARVHRLIYLAIPLALGHLWLIAKTHNQEAMIYTAIFVVLALLRLLPLPAGRRQP